MPMETKLNNVLDAAMQNEDVIGVCLSDNQGLCYCARGKASSSASGVITAIANQAAKIHPNLNAPVVILESNSCSVSIAKYEDPISKQEQFTGAIYKSKSKKM